MIKNLGMPFLKRSVIFGVLVGFLILVVRISEIKSPDQGDHLILLDAYQGMIASESFEYRATIEDSWYTKGRSVRLIHLESSDHPTIDFFGYDHRINGTLDTFLVSKYGFGGRRYQSIRTGNLVEIGQLYHDQIEEGETVEGFSLRDIIDIHRTMFRAVEQFVNPEHLIMQAYWDEDQRKCVISQKE